MTTYKYLPNEKIFMKKKNKILFYPIIMIGILLMLTYSCKKDKKDEPNPT